MKVRFLPAAEIEFRIVKSGASTLVSLVNFGAKPQHVGFTMGVPGRAVDLLSGAAVNPADMTLQPSVPMLLEIK